MNGLLNKQILLLMDLKRNWDLIVDKKSRPVNMVLKENKKILEILIPRSENLIYLSKKEEILKQINYYFTEKTIDDIIFYSKVI